MNGELRNLRQKYGQLVSYNKVASQEIDDLRSEIEQLSAAPQPQRTRQSKVSETRRQSKDPVSESEEEESEEEADDEKARVRYVLSLSLNCYFVN